MARDNRPWHVQVDIKITDPDTGLMIEYHDDVLVAKYLMDHKAADPLTDHRQNVYSQAMATIGCDAYKAMAEATERNAEELTSPLWPGSTFTPEEVETAKAQARLLAAELQAEDS